MRASVFAPVAMAVGVASAPAHAADDPVATVKDVAGKVAPAPAADLLDPVAAALPAVKVEGVLAAAKGATDVRRAKDGSGSAVAKLGKGVLKTAGGDVAFTGIAAKCTAAADGTVRGVTKIVQKGAAGAALPGLPAGLPAVPPVGYRVPTTDPGLVLLLNKQVRDPLGGMTISAVSVDSAPGTGGISRDFGVARCLPVKQAAAKAASVAAAAQSANPVGAVPAAPSLGGLSNGLPVGGLAKGLPVDGMAGGLPAGQIGQLTQVTEVAKGLPVQRRQSHDAVTDTVGGLLASVAGAAHGAALPQVGGLANRQALPVKVPADATGAVGKVGGRAKDVPGQATDTVDTVTSAARPMTDAVRVAAEATVAGASAGLPAATEGGLSGLFGGLPGLNGALPALPANALPAVALPAQPALPSVPAAPQLPAAPMGH